MLFTASYMLRNCRPISIFFFDSLWSFMKDYKFDFV